jgi:DNA-directed RNA polymerase subunit RPC12/RpoP
MGITMGTVLQFKRKEPVEPTPTIETVELQACGLCGGQYFWLVVDTTKTNEANCVACTECGHRLQVVWTAT